MSGNFDSRSETNGSRTAIIQGSLIKVCADQPRKHAGGGRRGAQHGHTRRSELRLHNFLSTCPPPNIVIWLTYPGVRGPGGVGKHAKAFLGRLERLRGRKLGAVIKMEIQERLSPELAILVWNLGDTSLDTGLVEDLWSKTIKVKARVQVEIPRDWMKLAAYVSKRVEVTKTGIVIGAKSIPFHKSGASGTSLVKRAHNPEISAHTFPTSLPTKEAIQTRGKWIYYTGRFHWKHQKNLIPRYAKKTIRATEKQIASVRGQINSKRKEHFVGDDSSMTLRGTDAIKMTRELGFNAGIGATVSSDAKGSSTTPLSISSDPGGRAFPSLIQKPVRIPHVADVMPEGRGHETCFSPRPLFPLGWSSLYDFGRQVASMPGEYLSSLPATHGLYASGGWLSWAASRDAGGADLEPIGDGCGIKPLAASWAAITKATPSSTSFAPAKFYPAALQDRRRDGKDTASGLLGIREQTRGVSAPACGSGAASGCSGSAVLTASHDNAAGSQARRSCRSPGSWHIGCGQPELPHGRRRD